MLFALPQQALAAPQDWSHYTNNGSSTAASPALILAAQLRLLCTQVDPWSEEAFNSAPSSPRPNTPDLAKQRGSSLALEALRAPAAAQTFAGPHCVWDRKGRGSSAALDALRSSEVRHSSGLGSVSGDTAQLAGVKGSQLSLLAEKPTEPEFNDACTGSCNSKALPDCSSSSSSAS